MNPSPDTPLREGFRHLGDRSIHEGAIWDLVAGSFESPEGERFEREIVRSSGAVGVLALLEGVDGSAETVLVRQYRAPFDAELLEIPAGLRDVDGEADTETARRELIEEAGLAADHVKVIASFKPSAGMTDSVTTICVATGCREVPRQLHGPEERHMTLVRLRLDDAVEMVRRGEISDAKTIVALLWHAAFGRS